MNDPFNQSPKPGDRPNKILENDPKFQQAFLEALHDKLIVKKFGVDFYDQYRRLELRAGLEGPEEKVKQAPSREEIGRAVVHAFKNPLLPEVRAFEQEVRSMTTPDDAKWLAEEEGLEFTPEEIEEAKRDAIEFITHDDRGQSPAPRI